MRRENFTRRSILHELSIQYLMPINKLANYQSKSTLNWQEIYKSPLKKLIFENTVGQKDAASYKDLVNTQKEQKNSCSLLGVQ